jgi:membrane protease YdiL (CAAX protease family)
VLFALSLLLFPQIAMAGFNTLYGQTPFDDLPFNIEALSMLLGFGCAYGLTIYYARDYFKLTMRNMSHKLSFGKLMAAIVIGLIFTIIATELMYLLPPPEGFQKEVNALLKGTLFSSIVLILILTVFAPIAEEFVFRAYLFDSFSQKYSFATTSVLTAAMFTLPHMPAYYNYLPAAGIIFSLGLVLAYYRKKHESILPCILLHASYNAGLVLFFFAANTNYTNL